MPTPLDACAAKALVCYLKERLACNKTTVRLICIAESSLKSEATVLKITKHVLVYSAIEFNMECHFLLNLAYLCSVVTYQSLFLVTMIERVFSQSVITLNKPSICFLEFPE